MAKMKRSRADEIAELENAYAKMTGPKKEKKKSPLLSVLLVIVLIFAAGVMAFCFLGERLLSDYQRLGDVTVAGVKLNGMTKAEAREALTAATADTYTQMDMVILVDDTQVALSPALTGAALDIEGALDAALSQGEVTTVAHLGLNMASIEDALNQLDATYNAPAGKTTCVYSEDTRELVITMGSPQTGLDIAALRDSILAAYESNVFRVRQDCSMQEPEKPDVDALHQQYCIAPVDAVMDMEVFTITPESAGIGFDLEAAKAAAEALGYGESMVITLSDIPAEVTEESLAALLYRDVLASYRTVHTWETNRTTNLRLACEAINGVVLMPGEQFGYNETLGERTEAKGYKPAGAYVNGETVNTVGGGICQVSSTLYYCTLIADLQIDKRYPHSYVSSYMPMGMDATVSWGGPDFLFSNNTRYPIRIEAYVEGSYVYVSLIGTDEKDYYVEMEYEILDTIGYDTVYKELPPDNEKGLLDGDIITTPYTGYKVKTYKCRYDKETGALLSRDFEADSNYKKRDKVICQIVDPNAPSESTDPTDPSGETTPPEATTPSEETAPPPEETTTPTETEPPAETGEPIL